ncbi:MAG: aspartate/glutamate racemase family protein [Lysobacter sp.]|nr:aspartate/glutamate racemase family protein [Lysobacter sp.]MDQ3269469.1 aspartate/glutamate racemase family protein [Pseudomonadota bacterium]
MNTIGLIGGLSWQSSIDYYRLINEDVQRRLGGHHNARSMMVSVDFAEAEAMMSAGDWDGLRRLLVDAGRRVEAAGADFALLCTNTMHKLAGPLQDALGNPLLNIVDAAAGAVRDAGLSRVALLGTRFVMSEDFYVQRLADGGVQALVPDAAGQAEVDRIIFEELTRGRITASSRQAYLSVIDRLQEQGAQGVILGCTEIGLLLKQDDCTLPLFDTTAIHARTAVDRALG